MRRGTVSLIAMGSLLACLLGGVAAAQEKSAQEKSTGYDDMQALREKLRTDKRAVVASVLALDEKDAKAFWPVYNAYQGDMIAHYDKVIKLLDAFAQSYDKMTDETAHKLLQQYLALERDHIAILNSYLPRFEKVLPPRKVAQLYQVENKARALVNYDLARNIPIVK
jgi:hypothetical protein